MHYCMSDIHGEYDRFIEMLKLIQFAEDDYLFVIGDTIDRFRDGVRVLRHIMAEPNMFLISSSRVTTRNFCMTTSARCTTTKQKSFG